MFVMVMALWLWLWLWRQVECQTISAIPWHGEDLELTIFGDVLYGIIADFIAVQLEVRKTDRRHVPRGLCHVAVHHGMHADHGFTSNSFFHGAVRED